MKSSQEYLKNRGFIKETDIENNRLFSNAELQKRLYSKSPVERSVAVRLLSERNYITHSDFVECLLKRLKIEKSLYTKIEICEALEKGNAETAKKMVNYLGVIGKNQHHSLPDKVSKKISYPLPRDIIARSFSKMDISILPVLLDVLSCKVESKISEVIDAIGFLLFYHKDCDMKKAFKTLINTMANYSDNDIIFWKCTLCLSAFHSQDSIDILNKIANGDKPELIKSEASRSLKIIRGI